MSASATTATPKRRPDAARVQRVADAARKDVATGFETIRSTAAEMGDRMPALMADLKSGASAGARTVEAWPESTRRMVAAASIGLGAGLILTGAPRLMFGVALLPALAVAFTRLREDGDWTPVISTSSGSLTGN